MFYNLIFYVQLILISFFMLLNIMLLFLIVVYQLDNCYFFVLFVRFGKLVTFVDLIDYDYFILLVLYLGMEWEEN